MIPCVFPSQIAVYPKYTDWRENRRKSGQTWENLSSYRKFPQECKPLSDKGFATQKPITVFVIRNNLAPRWGYVWTHFWGKEARRVRRSAGMGQEPLGNHGKSKNAERKSSRRLCKPLGGEWPAIVLIKGAVNRCSASS